MPASQTMPEIDKGSTATSMGASGLLVPMRMAAALALIFMAAILGCRFLDAEDARSATLKVVLPTLGLGIVPGALVTMLWAPRPQLSLLELLGFGVAVSFGLVHLLTIAAITLHLNAAVILVVLALASAAAVGRIARRSPGAIVVMFDEIIVLALVTGLAVVLFLVGSPFDTFEDQVHVAIARRLSQLGAPSLDNIYFAPGIVYTYPFPGTHYYVALIARLGDIDPLFLYHKLRFFWGPAALVMLYLAAHAVFRARAVACAVISTAVVLVCTGIFGMVPRLSWSQLIPFSHASDVAMTVLLPAMMVTAFGYIQASMRRERGFFFAATAMLVLMLTCVHIREVVQFAVYVGGFVFASFAIPWLRPYSRRGLILLAVIVVVATIYTVWQSQVTPLVSDIVGSQRARLVSILTASSVSELLVTPTPTVLEGFVPYYDLLWGGLTPFLLFAGPPLIVLFRREPLVWLLSSGVTAYLVIMSVPLVALPYIYFTYFEILYTPVRNVIFFVYLFAGAFLYTTTIAVSRIDCTRLSVVVAGGLAGLFALVATLSINRSTLGFFAPLLLAYAITFVTQYTGSPTWAFTLRRVVVTAVTLLALVALWPEQPPLRRTAVVNVRWTTGLSKTRQAALEKQFQLTEGRQATSYSAEANVWSYRLHDLSRTNVEALVTHSDVVDTHHIDRSRFAVPPQPPAAEHPFLGVERIQWLHYPGWALLVGTTLCVWVLGFLVPLALVSRIRERVTPPLMTGFREPFYRHAVPFALCLASFAVWSLRPTLSPLHQTEALVNAPATPRSMIEQIPCTTTPEVPAPYSEDLLPTTPLMLPERTACPPDYSLIEWVTRHVSADAVLAINRWNPNLPSVFMPQQVVVFPRIERTFLEEHTLFSNYYRFYDDRLRRYGSQPFFNAIETPAERVAFVQALGVTHILVDPAYYDEMRPILDELVGQFSLEYAHAKWAVYSVLPLGSQRRPGV